MIGLAPSEPLVIIGGLGMQVIFVAKLIGMDQVSTGFRGNSQRAQIDASPREVQRPGQDIDERLRYSLDPQMQLVIARRDAAEDEGIVGIRCGEERR